jgi:hypothetical protein
MSTPNPSLSSVFVQPSGAGNKLKYIDPENIAAAYSGGGIAVESDFVRGRYVGSRITQNPGRVSMQLSARRRTTSELRKLAQNVRCLPNVYILTGCPPQSIDRFELMTILVDAAITGNGVSGNIADGTTIADPKLMDQLTFDGAILLEARPLGHTVASSSPFAAGINHIIRVGEPYCAGPCGPENDGAREFLAVGDGITPATIPNIAYTRDGGVTWVTQTIAAVTNGVAEAVAIAGNRVIVAVTGTTPGLFSANLQEVMAGTATFQAGSTVAHSDVIALDDVTVLAVGAAGRISLSQDGGFSWTQIASGVATALNRVAAGTDKNVVWIVGASGVVLRLRNLAVVEAFTVSGIGTDAVTAAAVPRDRTGEFYFGTATGEIWRTLNAEAPTPVWEELQFDKPTGGGIVEDIQFVPNDRQPVMFVVQTNAATESRVLVDYTGGAMGNWTLPIGSFTDPVNSVINSIAPANVNFALTAGEVDVTNGFVGQVYG